MLSEPLYLDIYAKGGPCDRMRPHLGIGGADSEAATQRETPRLTVSPESWETTPARPGAIARSYAVRPTRCWRRW